MSQSSTAPAPTAATRALRRAHPAAGGLAMATIAAFLVSTVTAEALGDAATIATVKRGILYGLCVLVPALMAAGASGFRLSRGRTGGTAGDKARRMKVIAGNGVLVLIPAAVTLDRFAQAGDFGAAFAAVQALELLAGLLNLFLMGRNMRDGLRMARAAKREP